MESKIASESEYFKFPWVRLSIRAKLFTLLFIPFFIPLIGYSFIKNQEQVLRENEQALLADYARVAASALTRNKDEFINANLNSNIDNTDSVYASPISYSPLLDGYFDDWPLHLQPVLSYNLSAGTSEVFLTTDNKSYYFFIRVLDNDIHYFNPENPEHFEQILLSSNGNKFAIFTAAPGNILAKKIDINRQFINEPRVNGYWEETDLGYNLELKIPKSFFANNISLELTDISEDIDGNKTTLKYGTEKNHPISSSSQEVQDSLSSFSQKGLRFWVSDLNSNVLASTGSIKEEIVREDESFMTTIRKAIYRLILKQPTLNFTDTKYGSIKLENISNLKALEGTPYQHRYATPDDRAVIMSAAHPVFADNQVIGAVTVEKNSNKILLLHNKAMENIIDISIIAFILTLAFLLYLTTHISRKIIRLRNYTQSSISSDGRIIGIIPQTNDTKDEISDLTDSFHSMIKRVSQYNDYLENMAGRLSHELKTPLAIVSSSLDNMSLCDIPEDLLVYHKRAVDGINRLRHILSAMSEATRLEQSLDSTSSEPIDLTDIINSYCQGFQSCFADIDLSIQVPQTPVKIIGNKDLIAQMLDKLLANAVDFHEANTPITVSLIQTSGVATIAVSNKGKVIPDNEIKQIFSPMISLRPKSAQKNNLGLGLYIAHLICIYHNGHIYAENLRDNSGIAIYASIPNSVI